MKSFPANQNTPTTSTFSSYQFDFGLGSSTRNSNKPLKDQKPNPSSSSSSSAAPSWAPQQPNKPSWTHQPAPGFSSAAPSAGTAGPGLAGPTSLVGDMFGKSRASGAPSSATVASSIGIVPKSNPNLFCDLVESALNQGKSTSSNVPLKAAPARNLYSMGNLADSLPKSGDNGSNSDNSTKNSWGPADNYGNLGSDGANISNAMKMNWGSTESFGNFSSWNQSGKPIGGQPMKPVGGVGSNAKQDPFVSLMNFGSKNSGNAQNNLSLGAGSRVHSSSEAFQNAPMAADLRMPAQKPTEDLSFGEFKNAQGSDFGILAQPQTNGVASDPLDSLFSSSGVSGSQQFGEMDDWDVGREFGGENHSGATIELEVLPAPPAGVTSLMAKSKGMSNYKGGQYADAIKWLSWAVVLIEKNGDSAEADEVLACRASCYKEVGEYKKAVADCSKVLEHDGANVSVLLQRALLYESTEKYRLGADDLRMVLKLDPSNRLAKSTIHRLNKMAD